jgi:hypothetical protein
MKTTNAPDCILIECPRFGKQKRHLLTGAQVTEQSNNRTVYSYQLGTLTDGGYMTTDKGKRLFMDDVFEMSLFVDEMGLLVIEGQDNIQRFFHQAAPYIQKEVKIYDDNKDCKAYAHLALASYMNDPYDNN